MSKIQQQIKELQTKQLKLDYIEYIKDLLLNDTKCVDFDSVKDSVLQQILPHLLKLSETIENDGQVIEGTLESTELPFSFDEIEALKAVASRLLTAKPNAAPVTAPVAPSKPATPPAPVQEMSVNDKMNFAMNHRHLSNKKVKVLTDDNVNPMGTVVGLDAPFVVVQTDAGPRINVPLEKVIPQ